MARHIREISLTERGMNMLPNCMMFAPRYFALEPANDRGSVFISTVAEPNGHCCTYVDEREVIYLTA